MAAGAGMRKIRSSRPDVVWIQGPGPCDLFTWLNGQGGVKEQELTFFGRTIVWKTGKLLTGLCHEAGAGVLGESGLLDYDSVHDPLTLNAGKMILATMPESARSELSAHLAKAIDDALAAIPR